MAAGILGRIEWFRNHNFSIVQQLKKYYKRKKFQKYARIHQDLSLCARSDCWADKPGMITIGAQCEIFGTLHSMGDGRISIGDHTCIYDNNNHPTDPVVREKMCMEGFHTDAWRWTHSDSKPITIEDNVWIGENAVILKGVQIGRGSIIACNAVVTKDVPPYTIAAGNPARIVKDIPHEDQ